MLWFLHKNLPSLKPRHRFLLQTIALSAGLHGALVLIFFISISFFSVHTIIVRKGVAVHNAPLVLVPLARRVGADIQKPAAHKQAHSKKSALTYSVKKAAAKKSAPAKVAPKKTKPLPVAKSTMTIAKKAEKKSVLAPKKVVDVAKPEIKPAVKPEEAKEPEILEVGRDELQELQIYQAVYSCVEKEWKPPVGIPASSECEVAFVIDKQGRAVDICMARSSTILMYDSAARLAVARAAFEPSAWGKRCTIVFKL